MSVLMQSTTSFPSPCISFSHNIKVGKGPGNKATQTFATLVHATSNNETVGVDYGNIFSVSWCTCIYVSCW